MKTHATVVAVPDLDAIREQLDSVKVSYVFVPGSPDVIPFDRLWVTEANAPAAEQAYFAHSRREKVDAYATVRVIDGDAGIEELYIAGQPLRDYLRAQAP